MNITSSLHHILLKATLGVVMMLPCGASANTTEHVSLSGMYSYAKQNSLNFLQAESNWKLAQENIPTARANLLPSLQANVGYTESYTSIDGSAAIQNFSPTGDGQQVTGQITLNQPLYNHGAWAGYKAAKKLTQSASHTYNNADQLLILELADTYFNVLLKQEELKHAQARENALQRQYEDTNNQFEIGKIAESPVLEAQAAYDLAQANRIIASNALTQAQTQLTLLTHKPLTPAPLREGSLSSITLSPLEEWGTAANANNPNLLAAQTNLDAKHNEIRARQAQHFPSLDLQVSHNYSDQSGTEINNLPVDDYAREDTRASINLTIPLYSGGATASNVRKVIAERDFLEQQVRNLTLQIQQDSFQAYQNVVATQAQMIALQRAEQSAKLAHQNIQFEHQEGLRALSDVLTSRQNLFQAQLQLSQGKYRYLSAFLSLHAIAGKLSIDTLNTLDYLFE